MNILFSDIDLNGFVTRIGDFCGEESVLIFPQHIGVKFTQQNKIFRSSVWSSDGKLLSAGFPKFTNYGENPENFPVPNSLTNCNILYKEDGSLAIVDYYNGKINIRSRGTLSVEAIDNGQEWIDCFDKLCLESNVLELIKNNPNYSFLFEFVSPTYRIVLKYDEPKYIFIGAINKEDYSLITQDQLDIWTQEYDLDRPKRFSFSSVDELKQRISEYKGIEGCCLYSKNDQVIHKIKSEEYLVKHRLKNELGSFERVVDFYFTQGRPNFNDFIAAIEDTVDYETAQKCIGDASRICEGMKEVQKILDHMQVFIDRFKSQDLTRKQIATEVLASYGNTNRASYAFKILDGKDLEDKDYKKILYQVLKK